MATPILYVILDGVGDRPFPPAGNMTPLEAANTPNLDLLTSRGRMGMLYTVKQGVAPESDAGVFSLLSYDVTKLDLSRGVVEALGSGVEFERGDLGLRCNFATVEDGQIIDRRAGRNVATDEARELVRSLNEDPGLHDIVDFELKATIGHRCSLVFHGKGTTLSGSVSNLDPAYERKGKVAVAKPNVTLPIEIPNCVPIGRSKAAAKTAKLLNEFASRTYHVLRNHPVNVARIQRDELPANFLLMRDAGTQIPRVQTLKRKFGFRAVAVADMPVELGIAKIVGMDVQVFPPERTLQAYSERAERAAELVGRYDLVYVHLKGPDEPGHDGDFQAKKKAIEDIDSGFFGHLPNHSCIVCVTGDHSTPCTVKGHSDDPVPILVAGGSVQPDGSKRLTEAEGRHGSLGIIRHGYQVLPILKKLSRQP